MQRSMSSPGRMIGGEGVKAATESVEAVPVQRRRVAVVMYLVVFLYAAAFWIQTGVMPFLSKKLGADPVVFGYMETVFAVVGLLGGPLFGRLGDIFGARAALLLAFLSSFLTYLTLAMANGIPALFFSRLFGFMMHVMHGAQMVMTDVSGRKERADVLGKLGVAYGIGMMVGPSIGGHVTTMYSEQFAAAVAAALCVVAIGVVLLCVPDSTKGLARVADDYNSGTILNVRAIFSLLAIPTVAYVVMIKTVAGIPAGVFHAMFTVINIDRLELTPETNGQLLSYIGLLNMLMQGFVVGYVNKRVSDNLSLIASLILVAAAYLILTMTSTLLQLCFVLAPLVMGETLIDTLTTSIITKVVPDTATGTSLGLNMATRSVIRSISPTLGGYMYHWLGYPAFGVLGFLTSALMTGVVFTRGGIPGL